MSESPEKRQLTLSDPVDQDTLQKLGALQDGQLNLALELLQIEEAKVRLLVASRRINDERTRVFERIALERGLTPTTSFEVQPDGKVVLVSPQGAQTPATETPAAETPAMA